MQNGHFLENGILKKICLQFFPLFFYHKPRNASYNIDNKYIILTWIPSRNAESFNVYFWKSKFPQALKKGEKLKDGPSASGEPIFIKNQKERYFEPG